FAGQSGSLFVLHLKTEGIVLHDPRAILEKSLSEYAAPASYDPYLADLRTASDLLNVSKAAYRTQWDRCHRLVLFLLRSTLYARPAQRGKPVFSMSRIASAEGDAQIEEIYALKYHTGPNLELFLRAVRLLLEYLPREFSSPVDSPESILDGAIGINNL